MPVFYYYDIRMFTEISLPVSSYSSIRSVENAAKRRTIPSTASSSFASTRLHLALLVCLHSHSFAIAWGHAETRREEDRRYCTIANKL